MGKLSEWLKASHRWKHLIGGLVISLVAFWGDFLTGLYAGILVAAALEFKDKRWGGKWDWIDFALTSGGALIGSLIVYLIF